LVVKPSQNSQSQVIYNDSCITHLRHTNHMIKEKLAELPSDQSLISLNLTALSCFWLSVENKYPLLLSWRVTKIVLPFATNDWSPMLGGLIHVGCKHLHLHDGCGVGMVWT